MAGKAPSFQGMKPPPGYVAGLGRGATGFTTRSDIGPGAPAPPMGAQATLGDAASGSRAAMARGYGRGRGAPGAGAAPVDDEPDQQPAQFDEFQGGDAGIFAARKGEYDDDDREADAIWASVDDHMDSRRRDEREARLKAELEKYRKDNPKITEQFADAKRKLSAVSYEEWDAIPDIGDYSIKKKKGGREFAPAPDTLLQKAMAERETNAYDDATADGRSGAVGLETRSVSDSRNDLTAVGEGRSSVLGLKLDAMGDSVAGQTVVDPKGYLTGLSSVKVSSTSDIADVKKARLLLKSVISTNPKHAPGWIAAARLEELAGKMSAARSFAQRGCDACPGNADVWIENARLNPPETARAILARAVEALPTNVDLWTQAAFLEEEDARKRRVLRKALERVPTSVRLWKAVVDLSPEEDAKILLARATECCPQHVDLWLALARLETRENARVVLNKARETLPAEPLIWIAAAKLEEAHGDSSSGDGDGADERSVEPQKDASLKKTSVVVHKIIERAIKSLRSKGVAVDREYWLREAETAEKAGSPLTCRAVVRAAAGAGVDDADRKRTWKADAAEALARGAVETARTLLEVAVEQFPGKKSLWVRYAELEQTQADRDGENGDGGRKLNAVLKRAVAFCPRAVVLWLMAAKALWRRGDVPGARAVLEEAFAANPDAEEVWLAAFKLEFETRQPARARALLKKARERLGDPSSGGAGARVYVKSAIVEREVGDVDSERALLREGLEKHPHSEKLWLMLGQLERRSGADDAAREAYQKGARRCPRCAPLWIELAALETARGKHNRARAVLEQGRLRVQSSTPGNGDALQTGDALTSSHSGRSRVSAAESLWLASIRRERGDAFCFSAPFYGDEVLRRARVAAAAGTSALGPFGDETQTGAETNDLRTTFDKDASLSASEALAAMALRECPDSGALWAERVASAPRPQRKSRSVDALKRCGDDARVVAAVARLFWLDRKVDKARAWFQRATTLDPSDGDHWASLYAFEKRFGGESRVAAAREACVAAAPNRGDFWCAARKDPKMWHDPVEKTLERVAELVPGGEER